MRGLLQRRPPQAMELTRRQNVILLFAGEHDDRDTITTPAYWRGTKQAVEALVVEICRQVQPKSAKELVEAVYGRRNDHEIDGEALGVLQDGFDHWTKHRGNRGL